jgi:hypothetical protein
VLSIYPLEYFQHLVLVRLDSLTRAQRDGVNSYDCGAPVYLPVRNDHNEIVAARPVGILSLYGVSEYKLFGVTLPVPVHTPYMYYQPVERILDRESKFGLELLTTPENPNNTLT